MLSSTCIGYTTYPCFPFHKPFDISSLHYEVFCAIPLFLESLTTCDFSEIVPDVAADVPEVKVWVKVEWVVKARWKENKIHVLHKK